MSDDPPPLTRPDPAPASGSRRRAPDADDGSTRVAGGGDGPARGAHGDEGSTRAAAVRRAQVRAVGTAFLRARPLVVAPVAIANAVLVATAAVAVAQRAAMAAAFGAALALFAAERAWLARAVVGERWLAASLAMTSIVLAIGCGLSGGLASPILPLVLAPVAVATAAFGRGRATIVAYAIALVSVAALAFVPAGWPWPPIPTTAARAMTVVSFAGLLALTYAGVAGLVGAYVRSGEVLDRMRLATIAEAASRMRATEQVGARVAHELKNPLAAIKALLQILPAADERAGKRLGVALGEVDRMDAIVRDYLAFARPLADLELAPLDLRALADDVIAVLEARAAAAGVRLEARGGAPEVTGDARRVREALWNLADNAVTAAPRGGAVALAVAADADGARVDVIDDGPGLPAALHDAPPFTTTRAGGTGLGLTIARAAVQQHGGTLAFTPRPGGGTIATVRLPREPGASIDLAAAPREAS